MCTWENALWFFHHFSVQIKQMKAAQDIVGSQPHLKDVHLEASYVDETSFRRWVISDSAFYLQLLYETETFLEETAYIF